LYAFADIFGKKSGRGAGIAFEAALGIRKGLFQGADECGGIIFGIHFEPGEEALEAFARPTLPAWAYLAESIKNGA